MFRDMRRIKQLMSNEDTIAILEKETAGTLALVGDDGYTYSVPISYVYHDGKLYFHSGKSGHKIDAIKNHEKVSFSIIETDKIVPEEYTTYFRSVVVFGKIRILEDDAERLEALRALAAKYSPEQPEGREKEIQELFNNVAMIELSIDHMTGKEAIEFVRAKETK